MLKVWVLLALVVPGVAAAAPDADLSAEWARAHYECRMGETRDGEPLAEEARNEACAERDVTGDQLLDAGYCWHRGEQEWHLGVGEAVFCDEEREL